MNVPVFFPPSREMVVQVERKLKREARMKKDQEDLTGEVRTADL